MFRLPRLPLPRPVRGYCNGDCSGRAVFSAFFGLFVNSGNMNLSLNLREWAAEPDASAWQQLAAMNIDRRLGRASLCTIGAGAAQKLFVCSGGDDGKAEVYDPVYDTWTQIQVLKKPFESKSGIHYSALSQRVYVAGGCSTEQQVAYYDINRNVWIELPDTITPHQQYPALWCNHHAGGEQVLYIAGHSDMQFGSTEWLDLRESTKQWHVAARHDQLHKYVRTPESYPQISKNFAMRSPVEIRRVFV